MGWFYFYNSYSAIQKKICLYFRFAPNHEIKFCETAVLPRFDTLYIYLFNDICCYTEINGVYRNVEFSYGPGSFVDPTISISTLIDCDPSCWTCSQPYDSTKCDLSSSVLAYSSSTCRNCGNNVVLYNSTSNLCYCEPGFF